MTSTPFWRKRSADKRWPSHASSARIFLVQHLSRAKRPSSVASRHLLPAVRGEGIMCVTSPPRIRSGAGSSARCAGRRHRVHRIASVMPQPSTIVYEDCGMHSSQYFQRLTVTMKHTFSFQYVSFTPDALALHQRRIACTGAPNACDAAQRCAAAVPALQP